MRAVASFWFVAAAIMIASFFQSKASAQTENQQDADLKARVAALEKEIAHLKQQIHDDRLANNLRGRWLEQAWIRSGTRIDESKEVFGGGGGGAGGPVEWRLATDISSERIVLSPEPEWTSFGKFHVDTSTSPASIDFQVSRNGQPYRLRGIVKYTYMKAEIAVPTELFDGDKFLDPPRPADFKSTKENGVSVYRLIRESYKRTGVW